MSKKLKTRKWQFIKKIFIAHWVVVFILTFLGGITRDTLYLKVILLLLSVYFGIDGIFRIVFNVHLHTKRVFAFYQEDSDIYRLMGILQFYIVYRLIVVLIEIVDI